MTNFFVQTYQANSFKNAALALTFVSNNINILKLTKTVTQYTILNDFLDDLCLNHC